MTSYAVRSSYVDLFSFSLHFGETHFVRYTAPPPPFGAFPPTYLSPPGFYNFRYFEHHLVLIHLLFFFSQLLMVLAILK